MKTSGTEMRTHRLIHSAMPMASETYDGEKTASSTNVAGKSGYPKLK
jgi:hypothetical protein